MIFVSHSTKSESTMSEYLYCTPIKSGNVYPPVNSTIANAITNWMELPANTQVRCSLDNGGSNSDRQVFAENFLYGLIISRGTNNFSLEYKENGVTKTDDSGQPITLTSTKSIALNLTKPIYGYSVTNTYFNLWTDQSYLDNSAEVLYGKRGLYFVPNKNTKWDTITTIPSTYTTYKSFLFGIDNTAITFTKTEYTDRTDYHISANFAGNSLISQTNFPLLGDLKAEPISTANLEVIVSELTNKVQELEQEIKDIDAYAHALVPDLTKVINKETSKYYASR